MWFCWKIDVRRLGKGQQGFKVERWKPKRSFLSDEFLLATESKKHTIEQLQPLSDH